MLTLALAAALIGFGLLIAALITSNFWVAVACIVVCALGLALLLWDIMRSGRLGASTDDPPLFTIRDQASGNRAEPLLTDTDRDDDWTVPAPPTPVGAAEPDIAGGGTPIVDTPMVDTPMVDTPGDGPATSGLGAIVDTGPGPIDEPLVTGDAHDYIKTITGSFPRPTPQPAPAASAPRLPQPPRPDRPAAAGPPFDAARTAIPETGPIPAHSPYVGRRRRTAEPAAERAQSAPPVVTPPVAASPGSPISAPKPAAALDSDGIVVHDHTGPLPKITIVEPDA